MNRFAKIGLMIVFAHCTRFIAEWSYWTYCGGFFRSLFTSGSQACRGLKWVSDTANAQVITYVGTDLINAIRT